MPDNLRLVYIFYSYAGLDTTKKYLGGYGGEETPDPIPNSEAKLTSADGTAYCGRVGRRHSLKVLTKTVGTFCVYKYLQINFYDFEIVIFYLCNSKNLK